MTPQEKRNKTVHKFDKDKEGVCFSEKIELGQQVYVIYPLIEESENFRLKNLFSGYNLAIIFQDGFVVSMYKTWKWWKDSTYGRFLNKKSQI